MPLFYGRILFWENIYVIDTPKAENSIRDFPIPEFIMDL